MSTTKTLFAACVAVMLTAASASAQDAMKKDSMGKDTMAKDSMTMDKVACTDSGIAMVQADTAKMAAGKNKDMAMSELMMAKDMMAKHDMTGCTMHLEKASGAAMMK